MTRESFREISQQFTHTLRTHRDAIFFIRKHRLWNGFWNYSWVFWTMIIVAILFGLKLVNIIWNWVDHLQNEETINTFAEMGLLAQNLALESYNFLFTGALKYIMLLLLEVVIFHICRKTLDILTGEMTELTFKDFIKAQTRMLKVVARSFVMELILITLVKIFFTFFGFIDFLKPALIFGIQCYYLGFVVLDNYNEQFDMSIKESVKYSRKFIGVSLGIGLILYFLLIIPIIGSIIAPGLAAVTVTLVMFKLTGQDLKKQPMPANLQPLE